MKAIDQRFPVVLFVMPYKVVMTFEAVVEIVTIQINAVAQNMPVLLFIGFHFAVSE